jgi:hypothetical protein
MSVPVDRAPDVAQRATRGREQARLRRRHCPLESRSWIPVGIPSSSSSRLRISVVVIAL